MKFKTYLIFGAPGSGKGTQGVTLGKVPHFYHLACGDVFRSMDTRTDVGKAFLEFSSRGELVPDEITVQLWRARINDSVKMHVFRPDLDALILDGIPRNVRQADLMEELIDVWQIFHLSCPDRAALIGRLKQRALRDNRLDDANEEVIRRRLQLYDDESKPVLEYYGPNRITDIDATQPPIKVLNDICSTVIRLNGGAG